jgi:hypothetical protein
VKGRGRGGLNAQKRQNQNEGRAFGENFVEKWTIEGSEKFATGEKEVW